MPLVMAEQGIALSADPNYKVLGAAYPWIARRLLTEQSPELRDTLRTLLYKKGRFQVTLLYLLGLTSLPSKPTCTLLWQHHKGVLWQQHSGMRM